MNYYKELWLNTRRCGRAYHNGLLVDPSENRRNEMQETLPTKKENVLKTIEKYPESKKYFTELFPEWFSEAFISGDLFFNIYRYCSNTCGWETNKAEVDEILRKVKDHSTNLFSFDYPKFTYILAHLKNAKEYGLFNLSTGYQFRRNAVYIRKHDGGIMIPSDHLVGMVKIRSGGGK